MRITWGITGRGDDRTATVFCATCREILAANLKLNDARPVRDEWAGKHKCLTMEAKV